MTTTPLATLQQRVRTLADPVQAANLQRFFKTGPGEYGAGDRFLGLKVPTLRGLVKEHPQVTVADAAELLTSPIHEERLLALLILIRLYQAGGKADQTRIYRLYLANIAFINNWDLVDVSAPRIVGHYLLDRGRTPLRRLARSRSLWGRRIAIIATLAFIARGEFEETLVIAALLLDDEEDLIHKAVGWMLREVGKRDQAAEESFLKQHYRRMPRTMLRYAIERFPETLRRRYLEGRIKA